MSCFVCFEDCLEKSPCNCKDRYVHAECLRMLKMHGYHDCPVCLEPYNKHNKYFPVIVFLLFWCIL